MQTLTEALAAVAHMAEELRRYPGGLGGFAYSTETLDQWHAEAFRKLGTDIARGVHGLPDAEVTQVHEAMVAVCASDEYAAKEVAGRFLGAVRRLRVLAKIARHPRAWKFGTLVRALERGRFTKAQWAFAQRLAAEAVAA